MNNPHEEIAQTVQTYLDGFYAGDVAKLASVFHPTSALTQSEDGELHILSREAWLARVSQRPSPAALGLMRADEILAIDVVGPHIAHVKLKCAIPPRYFTDLLCLLKIDGRWQVVQKVYMTESKA
jgi:hypothetical protein